MTELFHLPALPLEFKTVMVATALLGWAACCAQGPVPSHCNAAERTFISAKMQKIHTSSAGITYSPSGKVLSICINPEGKSITQMIYRYGAPGNIELEQVASTSARFGIFTRSTSPHTGENIISFNRGSFHYYVTEALGQGRGISLIVYGNGKKLVDLFSGTEQDVDFVSLGDDFEFDFDAIKSPVLVKRAPVDRLD